MFKKLLYTLITGLFLASCYQSTPTNTRKVWADSLIVDSSGTYINVTNTVINPQSILVVSDTSALKSLSGTSVGVTVNLKSLSATNQYGGGSFVLVDSTTFFAKIKTCTLGAYAFRSPVAGKTWVRKEYVEHPQEVNVLWYGADPTYTNDSHDAFQAAFDDIPYETKSGIYIRGWNIYVPRGRYKVLSTVTINKNSVTFYGDTKVDTWDITSDYSGYANSIIHLASTTSGDTLFYFKYNASVNSPYYGPFVKNLTFKDFTPDTTGYAGIVLEGRYQATFENCIFNGFMQGVGLRLDGSPHPGFPVYIDKCMFTQNGIGIQAEYQYNAVWVTRSRFMHQTSKPYWSGSTGIVADADWHINNNLFDQVDTCIVLLRGNAIVMGNTSDGASNGVVNRGDGVRLIGNFFGLTDTYGGTKAVFIDEATSHNTANSYVFNSQGGTTKAITSNGDSLFGFLDFGPNGRLYAGPNSFHPTLFSLQGISYEPDLQNFNWFGGSFFQGEIRQQGQYRYHSYAAANRTKRLVESFETDSVKVYSEYTTTGTFGYLPFTMYHNAIDLYTGSSTVGPTPSTKKALNIDNSQITSIAKLKLGLTGTRPSLISVQLYPTSADSMRFIITNPTAATKDTSAWIGLH